MLAVNWNATTLAGAFLVGLVVGGASVIRLTRYLLEHIRKWEQRDD